MRRAFAAGLLVLLTGAWRAFAQPAPAAAITSIQMDGAVSGWAQAPGGLLRTGDGGAHWRDVSPAAAAWTGRITAAYFNRQTAWVVPEPPAGAASIAVFRTADGGGTWTQSTAAARSAGELLFVDARTGWMSVDLDGAAGSEALRLLRTADGGATWAQVARTDAPAAPAQSGLPFGGDKAGFAFLDARTGWMAGYVPRDNYSYLYVTRDGGRTWRRQALAVPAGAGAVQFGLTPPSLFAPSDGVLIAQLHAATGTLSLAYVTHDGGAHWVATAPVRSVITAASFLSARVGWTTDGTTLYATADAGHHWTIEPRAAPFASVSELDFVSPAIGWAVRDGSPSLLKTADGGRSWTVLR
jgi:photosystem II stability/assembly factor-like uncharacterized protein